METHSPCGGWPSAQNSDSWQPLIIALGVTGCMWIIVQGVMLAWMFQILGQNEYIMEFRVVMRISKDITVMQVYSNIKSDNESI